jgi:hypothetical protein
VKYWTVPDGDAQLEDGEAGLGGPARRWTVWIVSPRREKHAVELRP